MGEAGEGIVPVARLECGCQYLVEIVRRMELGPLAAACVEHQHQPAAGRTGPVQLDFNFRGEGEGGAK